MNRRPKRALEGPPHASDQAHLPRHYEGAAALQALLQASGSRIDADEVAARFCEARAEGGSPDEAIPTLWEGEPHFASPDLALRTYGNLLGLWDRLAAGLPAEPAVAEHGKELARPPAPAPEPAGAGPLSDDFVEAAWRHLADLPRRELERLMHRYENTQPDLFEFVRLASGEDEAVVDNADTLVFELWAMFELARPSGARRAIRLAELEQAADEAKGEVPEPALERYVEEGLAQAQLDGEPGLTPEQASRAGRIARAALRALSSLR